jgi:hypothetical protein
MHRPKASTFKLFKPLLIQFGVCVDRVINANQISIYSLVVLLVKGLKTLMYFFIKWRCNTYRAMSFSSSFDTWTSTADERWVFIANYVYPRNCAIDYGDAYNTSGTA